MRQRSCAHPDVGACDATGRRIRTRGGRRRACVNRQGAAPSRNRSKADGRYAKSGEIRKGRLHLLADIVSARENIRWRSKTHAAVAAAASEGASAAEVPDLLIAPSAPARNPAQAMGPTAERGSKIPRGTLAGGLGGAPEGYINPTPC